MTSQVIKNTFENIYRDDFKDSDNYYRILFNPGRAVQARELTQLQTSIQKEIERFGRNIFKEGAAVNPVSNIAVDNRVSFVKLQGSPILSNADIVGNTFTGSTSGVTGKVTRVVDAVDTDPSTIYVAYNSGGGSGNTNVRFSPGETITDGTNTYTVQSTNTTANPATGYGTVASTSEGEFFVLGHFVYVEPQSTIVSKYTSDTETEIGFTISESIVTENDDQGLYDNQGDLPNTTAPGAHRYRIRLTLTTENDIDSDDTFIYVAKVKGRDYQDVNTGRTEYNRIRDYIAQRTHEESGNYTVRPLYASFSEGDSDSVLTLKTTRSINYVNGYRIETPPQSFSINKSTTTMTENNEAVSIAYGNYVEVENLNGMPSVSTLEELNLKDAISYGGSTIGTARIRAIEQVGSEYRFHLFDIQMNSGQNFRDVRSLGTDSETWADVILERSNAILRDVSNNDVLFPLPYWRPSSISDISLTVQRTLTATTDGSGEATLNLSSPGEDYSSLSDWIVAVDSSGDIITPTITPVTTTQTSITGAPPNTALTIHGFVQKGGSSGSFRTKTLTTSTVTSTIESDGNGLLFLDLGKVDIYELDSARDGSSTGTPIASKFRLDNGQRDNFYDHGRLIVNSGETAPSGNVYAKFKHFTHGGTGNFFCVNSYSGQVNYNEIPTYRQKNGELVYLSDVLDFRSSINNAGTGFTGAGARVNELPQNTELLTADVDYYLPRRDLIVIDTERGVRYIEGNPGRQTKAPIVPATAMSVYSVLLNPNTLNENDLFSQFIENRRYTMRDIGRLDKRIEEVRELVTLSLLDIQASTLDVLDSDGFQRTKAGFLTDNFVDLRASEINNEEYRASIDGQGNLLGPSFREKNFGLLYDSEQSGGVKAHAEMITLDYTEELWFSQDQVSSIQNVNPYTKLNFIGTIDLSPSTDEWIDTVNRREVINSRNVTSANVINVVWTGASGSALARSVARDGTVPEGFVEIDRKMINGQLAIMWAHPSNINPPSWLLDRWNNGNVTV